MNKLDIYAFLKGKNIHFETTEHAAVYNMDELKQINPPYPAAYAKNLFVRDDKKRNYYLITIKGDKKVNLKEFQKNNNTRPLSFASPNDLLEILGLTPGSVTPLGVLNDKALLTTVFLDEAFLQPPYLIGVHPNDNTATLWLKTEDLIQILTDHKTTLHIVPL